MKENNVERYWELMKLYRMKEIQPADNPAGQEEANDEHDD